MAPKRKTTVAVVAGKEENGDVGEAKKRGRPRAIAVAPPVSSSLSPSRSSTPALSASPPPKKKPAKKSAKPKAAAAAVATAKETSAPAVKATSKEKAASKGKSVSKEKAVPKEKAPPKKKAANVKRSKKATEEDDDVQGDEEEAAEEVPEPVAKVSNGVSARIVIEHCKQCMSFKTRALKIEDALKLAIPDLDVVLNPEKPRRGCFEIRDSNGNIFISLQDMPRPFKKLKELDLDETAANIVAKLTRF